MSRLGPYTLLRRIAVGGMAEIFLARREGPAGFAKVVALKRILPHLSTLPDFVSMFLDEARLAARLTHPNIIQIYDFGEVGGTYFISMEYVPGEDLLSVLRRARELDRPVPPILAASILGAVCDALHYAHELRDERGQSLEIVHRDVTPSNVLISFDGVIKLADFGIAKAEHRSTHTAAGALKGKYAYMSPEQARGEKLDRRSDLFSLGVVAHEVLTGRRLFARESELAVLKAITEEPIPRPSATRHDVPAELESIVVRALERDRERRFASAQGMQLALEEYLAGTGSTGARLHLAHYLRDLFGHEAAMVRKRLAAGEVEDAEPTTAPPGDHAPPPPEPSQRSSGEARLALPLSAEPTALETPAGQQRAAHGFGGRGPGSGGTMANTHGEATPRPDRMGQAPVVSLSPRWRGARLVAGAGLAAGILAGLVWYVASRDDGKGTRADDPSTTSSLAIATTPPHKTPVSPTDASTTQLSMTHASTSGAPGPLESTPSKPAPDASTAPAPVKPPKQGGGRSGKPKPPARESAYLTIDVTPWAEVLVDGSRLGTTPIVRHKIDAGTHTLTLTNREEGFRIDSKFTVEPGAEHAEKRVLKKGKIACDVDPWAEVYAGTRKLGTTPLAPTALTEGTYTLRLKNPQLGREKKVRVTITAGATTRIKEKLE